LRYVLTANAPETKDNDFTWRDFQARNNNELVAILGNFVNRVVVLTHKYYGGEVPAPGAYEAVDREAFAEMESLRASLTENLETFHFREALKDAMSFARLGNKYLQDCEPWKVAKTDPERVKTIMYVCAQICASIAVVMEPFMPFMSARLAAILGGLSLSWDKVAADGIVVAGTVMGQPELLFEKIEDAAIQAQTDRLEAIKKQNAVDAFKPEVVLPEIKIDEFARLDLRVGTVLECEAVPKAKKLLRFVIDDGTPGHRVIVSGIAEHYRPEELVGKQVIFVANLAPAKIRGVVSQGMILSALNADGSLVVAGPTAPATPGAQVK
ncbi:MAG: methionine--tRNA ligase subunit beta, partial [Muribaculaceae bacterium]|nr:methionine--tRNA ligase subunit beta [Muribaculaceae bacterium]